MLSQRPLALQCRRFLLKYGVTDRDILLTAVHGRAPVPVLAAVRAHVETHGIAHPDILLHRLGDVFRELGLWGEAAEAYQAVLARYHDAGLPADHPNVRHTRRILDGIRRDGRVASI